MRCKAFVISKQTAWENSTYSVHHVVGCFNVTEELAGIFKDLWESWAILRPEAEAN
jgi:hypothetical protein